MKSRTKMILFLIAFVIVFIATLFVLEIKQYYSNIYDEGVALLEAGDYEAAVERFEDIPRYTHYRDVYELLINYQIGKIK